MKLKKRDGVVSAAAAAAVFAAAVAWLVISLSNTRDASRENSLDAVKRSLENGITLCYSIEGAYPESLRYLTENYGVSYDTERYIVHYDSFAANVRPSVTVIEKAVRQ